jgi:hypothetical protein
MKDDLLREYMPTDDSEDYFLQEIIKGKERYIVYHTPSNSDILIEDERLNQAIIKRLIELGCEIIPAPDHNLDIE